MQAVLEPWCPAFPGFVLYYARQRQMPSALQAFVDWIRDLDGGAAGMLASAADNGSA